MIGALLTEVNQILPALTGTGCQECGRRAAHITRDRNDARRLARLVARRDGARWGDQLQTARDHLAEAIAIAEAHLAEPHAAPKAPAPPKPRRPAKVDDRVKCPSCGGRAKPTANGIGAHRSPAGQACPRRLLNVTIDAPPVSMPSVRVPPVVGGRPPSPRPLVPATGNSIPPNGRCRECDKAIPPGRRLCGRCMARGRP